MKQEFIEIFRLSDTTTSFGGNYEKINNYFTVNQINTPNLRIDNFVNTSIFLPEENSSRAKEKIGFQADDKIILNVGNIVFSHKGQTDILSAMQNLIKRNNKIQLVLIGDGQDKEELVRLIGENPCHSHIHYLGAKDNREIIPYLQAADIFAFPSRHESFGIVQIEALSCGCPVVAYKNGGSEFIVRDDRLGALIEKQDKNLLEENIINVLQKQYDKQYLHDYVCAHFSGDAIKKKLLDLYFN